MRGVFVAIGLVAVVLMIGGCATAPGAHARWHTGWDKPGMTGEAFGRCADDGTRAAGKPAPD